MTTWAIIPVKHLRDSKSRLAHILSSDQRARLTVDLLSRVLRVLNNTPAVARALVISRDPAALKVARQYNALTFGEGDRQDLNIAITRGAHIAAAQGAAAILVLPADLPFITVEDVEMMLAAGLPEGAGGHTNGYYFSQRAMAICTDQDSDGTNALLLSPPVGFEFHYGPGSFRRHLAEAEKHQLPSRIVHALGLKFDLDTEDDWATYQAMLPELSQA